MNEKYIKDLLIQNPVIFRLRYGDIPEKYKPNHLLEVGIHRHPARVGLNDAPVTLFGIMKLMETLTPKSIYETIIKGDDSEIIATYNTLLFMDIIPGTVASQSETVLSFINPSEPHSDHIINSPIINYGDNVMSLFANSVEQ